MKYTYKKSDGEEIWTVGHDDNGKWIPESDWIKGSDAFLRSQFLNGASTPNAHAVVADIRKRIEEMMEGYRKEQSEAMDGDYYHPDYHRGAADACGLILDLPELRLFLPAKGEVE